MPVKFGRGYFVPSDLIFVRSFEPDVIIGQIVLTYNTYAGSSNRLVPVFDKIWE